MIASYLLQVREWEIQLRPPKVGYGRGRSHAARKENKELERDSKQANSDVVITHVVKPSNEPKNKAVSEIRRNERTGKGKEEEVYSDSPVIEEKDSTEKLGQAMEEDTDLASANLSPFLLVFFPISFPSTVSAVPSRI